MWDPQVCFNCLYLGVVIGIGWAVLYWLDHFIYKHRRSKPTSPDRSSQDG